MNKLRLSGQHYDQLCQHLFPGDNKEAVALALCGRSVHDGHHTLLIHDIFLVPYDKCYERKEDLIRWPTDLVNPFLEKAAKYNYAILKIHCHPGGGEFFSDYDNESDYNLFSSVYAWLDQDLPHASCIMLPDKRIFGRFFMADLSTEAIDQISVAGSSIYNWFYNDEKKFNEELHTRNLQAFGKRTIDILNKLKVGIVGCSGTGSPTIEQLKRLGIGEFVLVDPDHIEMLNLNRIIGSTLEDAKKRVPKVEVMKREIERVGFGSKATCYVSDISKRQIVKDLSQCDILFSCVDGAEGRHILNMIASHYLIPLIDMGVKLDADGEGGLSGIYGTVHFIKPLGSSLLSRGQYNIEQLRTESIKRTNKEELARNQYLAQVQESSPAVISINTQVASVAVNELLARIHHYRNIENDTVDSIRIMFSEGLSYPESNAAKCPYFSLMAGKGDVEPLLNNPELSEVYEKID